MLSERWQEGIEKKTEDLVGRGVECFGQIWQETDASELSDVKKF